MSKSAFIDATVTPQFAVEAYGVRLAFGASDDKLLSRLGALVPPGATPCSPEPGDEQFAVWAQHDGAYRIVGGETDMISADLDLGLGLLNAIVRSYVALHAPRRVFVHAGAAVYGGRAIVIPGRSFSGKTTLVAALVGAGATYYSDEYAVLDEHGLVHPYAKPLSIRAADLSMTDHSVESLGGLAGKEPVTVALVAVTSYRQGASWNPALRTPGHGMLALLGNSVAARERPDEVLPATRRAVVGAMVLEGERGEAEETASALLEAVTKSRAD